MTEIKVSRTIPGRFIGPFGRELEYFGYTLHAADQSHPGAVIYRHFFASQQAQIPASEILHQIWRGKQLDQETRTLFAPIAPKQRFYIETRVPRKADKTAPNTQSADDTTPRTKLLIRDTSGPWTLIAPPGLSDGKNGLWLDGRAQHWPIAIAYSSSSPIVVDAKLDEPAWQKAEKLEFHDSMGKPGPPRFSTMLSLTYDADYLYAAFVAVDHDITEKYQTRDDPIYEHEAVELFLMPKIRAPRTGPYFELQASPGGVLFDASFTGSRQGMNRNFNAQQEVATYVDGDIADRSDSDRMWISEWRIPWAGLHTQAPTPGEEWRMNAFRIEKYREHGSWRGEYTAWSPPMVGDFHHLAQFGRLRFEK